MEVATLISRLNVPCRDAMERAAQRAWHNGQPLVEIEHLLVELLEIPGGDLSLLLPAVGAARAPLLVEVNRALGSLDNGNSQSPVLSNPLLALIEHALIEARQMGFAGVRSALLLLALLEHDEYQVLLKNSSPSLLNVSVTSLRNQLAACVEQSAESSKPAAEASRRPDVKDNDSSALEQYTQDLTAEARAGRIDPIIGRDAEIRQCIDILLRRRQNNPILVGAPGVGKTAIVEGLALRIAHGEVPPLLQGVSLRALDLGLLQAGAGVKGEFEKRLKSVIEGVRNAGGRVILFIDEAHTLIGAGAAEGQSDAANLLKPALARGELRTLAATTWLEYKKYFEKDPALTRRFQLVQVEEPDEHTAVQMLRVITSKLEQHHGVEVLNTAIVDAVKLSQRYISDRQLPDKAISVLDTACARVSLAQHDVPPALESLRHRQSAALEELQRLRREQITGLDHHVRIEVLEREEQDSRLAAIELESRWNQERAAVRERAEIRQQLLLLSDSIEPQVIDAEQDLRIDELAARLERLESGLEVIRQDDPLVPEQVDSKIVASVIASWTGIPLGKMLADEAYALRTLAQRLGQRVMGQRLALATIAQRLQAYRAGLTDPHKPVGVFLLPGPTGVGKTETAYALADALYGGERNLISINLSEYQEAHTVSQLKGAPPGYVGYGHGGVLTEAVRRKPYSVVLLDEIEKAHPDVLEAFYNVFDKGLMEDGTGLVVDFKNTIILATCNVGAELILETPIAELNSDAFNERLRQHLLTVLRPAFLARMTVVPYQPLDEATLEAIVLGKLEKLRTRYKAATGKQFDFDQRIVKAVLAQCRGAGARDIENVLMRQVTGRLAEWVLE